MSDFFKKVLGAVMLLTTTITFSQAEKSNKFKEEYNTWAIGAGFSTLILNGDLRSFDTKSGDSYFNLGGYLYVDKMFNPILGVEVKVNVSQLGGEVQTIQNSGGSSESAYYRILYAETYSDRLLKVEGTSFGFETSLIIDLDNLWKRNSEKWNWAGYLGLGSQLYSPRLIIKDFNRANETYDPNNDQDIYHPDNVEDDGTIRDADYGTGSLTSSLYLNAGISVKYRLNEKFDIEGRGVLNLNNEDHLDAAISQKQTYESFFTGNIGVVYKFGKKKKYAIWVQDDEIEPFELVDTDKDGVQDELDQEKNTPVNADVYGNGVAIDSDKDGIKDYEDNCPLLQGPKENNGCPLQAPIVYHEPMVEELVAEPVVEFDEDEKSDIMDKINLLSKSIYFKSSSDQLKVKSYQPLNEIADVMRDYPDSRFKIEGHTDSRGNDNYNLELSKKRSKSVYNYLANEGVASNRLSSRGYGETRPLATNETEDGRQKNRRVEINFIDPDSEEGKIAYPQGTVSKRSGRSGISTGVVDGGMDSDGDGVSDIYDKEPNTPKESRVYGDGVSVDSDMDGIPDYIDYCPFVKGSKEKNGCPEDNEESNSNSSAAGSALTTRTLKDADGVQEVPRNLAMLGSVESELKLLASQMHFSRSEGHVLKQHNISILDKIGTILNDYPDAEVRIEVHTNNKPNLKYNLDLSKRRSFAIKKHLTKVRGIDSSRLDVVGLGGTEPKYDTDIKEENYKNNRVEIDVK